MIIGYLLGNKFLVAPFLEVLQIITLPSDSTTCGCSIKIVERGTFAQHQLMETLSMKENFWREKSRLNWHTSGDRNTKFFHKVTKIRQPLSGPNKLNTTSHVMYVDDIPIFCRGIKPNLLILHKLIKEYAQAAGSLPFNYLGVPLFKGNPRRIHLQPIVDIIIQKLAKWKAHSLSFMGRVELMKSRIQSVLIYSFHIYAWSSNLLNHLDSCMRNFLWSSI
ncbi:hypothetical protein Lal_00023904 [Lupinus albus]|nr:hypothetical protein Lal_00023904 [Lupinus albus]